MAFVHFLCSLCKVVHQLLPGWRSYSGPQLWCVLYVCIIICLMLPVCEIKFMLTKSEWTKINWIKYVASLKEKHSCLIILRSSYVILCTEWGKKRFVVCPGSRNGNLSNTGSPSLSSVAKADLIVDNASWLIKISFIGICVFTVLYITCNI